ncbi:MAG TPA: LEA type 2 family protein [Myxococcales bacterium]|nr:LEA type 2 family protein [Myxococcales bacterium]
MIRASALCVLLASAPSCPDLYSIGTHGFEVPTVTASSASAVPDPGGISVTVDFTAHNPNAFPISLSGVDYRISLQGSPVFEGTQGAFEVPGQGDGKQELKGVISRTLPVYRTLIPNQTATYRIVGTAHVDSPAGVPVDVDFEQDGSFVVPAVLP